MNTKTREKKKKAKEKQSKARVLRRRETIRAKAREDREIAKLDIASQERGEPIVDTLKLIDRDIKIAQNDIEEAAEMGSSEKVMKALNHNLEILHSMKEEYLDEQESKKTLNEELEKAGCKTIEEKVEYLQQQAHKLEDRPEDEAGNVVGTADVKWAANSGQKRPGGRTGPRPKYWLHEKKETAECEVVKAEDREDLEK